MKIKTVPDVKIPIGLDFDGVILDHTSNKIKLAEKHGITLQEKDTPSDTMMEKVGISTFKKIENILYDDPVVAFTSTLMTGAREVIAALKIHKIPFLLISQRRNHEIPIEILKKEHLWPSLFNARNTYFIAGSKDEKIRDENIKVYLDDKPSVLDVCKSVPHRVLFDPFEIYGDSSYIQVSSWNSFLEFLQRS